MAGGADQQANNRTPNNQDVEHISEVEAELLFSGSQLCSQSQAIMTYKKITLRCCCIQLAKLKR